MSGWVSATGEVAGFSGRILGHVFSGRVFKFFGETLRQSGSSSSARRW